MRESNCRIRDRVLRLTSNFTFLQVFWIPNDVYSHDDQMLLLLWLLEGPRRPAPHARTARRVVLHVHKDERATLQRMAVILPFRREHSEHAHSIFMLLVATNGTGVFG